MEAHEALFTRSRASVLTLLFANPRRRIFLNQLVREAGVGRGAVQRELAQLKDAGIIVQVRDGRRLYYQPDPECLIYQELASLILKTTGPVGRISKALQPLRGKIDSAFIYGSIAAGSETPESDIDLMVIGSMDFGEVVAATGPLTETFKREINPSVFSREEFQEKLRSGNPFLGRVLAGAKMFVIGGDDVLGGLVEE